MIRRIHDWNAYNSNGRKYDTRDFYRTYKKTWKKPVTEKKYREIIVDVINELIENKLMKYMLVKLPFRLGDIYVEDVKCGFTKKKTRVYKTDLVDWPKTLALWKSDESLRKKRVYVYLDLASFAKFRYKTTWKSATNTKYYDLIPKSDLKNRIFWELTMKEKHKNYG